RRQPLEQPHVLTRVGALRRAEQPEELVGGLDAPTYQLLRPGQVPQVTHPDAPATVLVLIRRPDAATRRADLFARFARPVEQLVEREREVCAVRDIELVL